MSKNFELLQQIGKERNLFQTSGRSSLGANVADYEPAAPAEIALPEVKPQKPETETRWPELVKEKKAESRRKEVSKKDLPRAVDSERIIRREELKLVQRLFPVRMPGGRPTPQVVIFSGAEDGYAASNICARSCEILAGRGDGPVCAVDASLGSPFFHRYFGLDIARGLAEALCEPGSIQEYIQNVRDTKLWVMPVGAASVRLSNADSLARLKARVSELRAFFKYVVIHSPVYSHRAAAPPSFGADGLVLVVEANSTRRDTVRELMEEIQIMGTPVLGVVLNNRTFPIPDAIYHKL